MTDFDNENLNGFISAALGYEFVNCIYGFCHYERYELWVILNRYDSEISRNIYMNTMDIEKTDILLIDERQLNYNEMPKPDIILKKNIAKSNKIMYNI